MNRKYGKGKWNPGKCSLFTWCEGQRNYEDDVYVKWVTRPQDTTIELKLKWDLGALVNKLKAGPKGVKDKKCKCATCADIKACLSAVEDDWDKKKKYHYVWKNCRTFVTKALDKCCLRE